MPGENAGVLCVDDDPRMLEVLRLALRKGFDVTTATSGAEGLTILKQKPATAVVMADMRMPGMDGAAFLTKVKNLHPDAVRLVLTGETGRDSAVAAVNDGQIFRFLTKPCSVEKLIAAVEAAVRHHRLLTSDKLLLQQTVMGSIRALVDILAIVNPIAFGRGSRIKRLALDLEAAVGLPPSWELEAAALLSQLGHVSLPIELVKKAAAGVALSAEETLLLGEAPKLTQSLIGRIPRLESVAAILAHAGRTNPRLEAPPEIAERAALLMIVLEYDALTSMGETAATAIGTLRARGGPNSAALLVHLAALQGAVDAGPELRELRLRELSPGMILLDDLHTELGTLLVLRGYEISQSFVLRMRNFSPAMLEEKVRVRLAGP
jgi:response regulator RpfG family c-di-GMP phosphodiesterase